MKKEAYFNEISGKTRFFSLFNFIMREVPADQAVMMSLILSTECIPNVTRLEEDPDFFELKFWMLRTWSPEEISKALKGLKKINWIDFKVILNDDCEKVVLVKINKEHLEVFRKAYEESKQRWISQKSE